MNEDTAHMPPKNLLLCFDAFGTLFKPRLPINQQYGDVARSYGLTGFDNNDVGKAFKIAFKEESKKNPNYGKENGLNPEIWWTNIINNTFKPLVKSEHPLPKGMVHTLLHRFWCDEGYTLFPDVQPLIARLRQIHKAKSTRIVIGVITNSDDRVPDILASLDLRVSPLRYGSSPNTAIAPGEYDIDFSAMSYDVGHEKPDRRIFLAAEEVLKSAWKTEGGDDLSQWRKVYIGDEYDKDVTGALNAGWNAVLVDRETAGQRDDLKWLGGEPTGGLYQDFDDVKAVGCSSLEILSQWLPYRP